MLKNVMVVVVSVLLVLSLAGNATLGFLYYDQTKKNETVKAQISDLNGQLTGEQEKARTLQTQLDDANAKASKTQTDLDKANTELRSKTIQLTNWQSLLCPTSWDKAVNSETQYWPNIEPTLQKLGIGVYLTQYKSQNTDWSKNSHLVMIDKWVTWSMILDVDGDCIIVNPGWKTFGG